MSSNGMVIWDGWWGMLVWVAALAGKAVTVGGAEMVSDAKTVMLYGWWGWDGDVEVVDDVEMV